MTLAPPPVSLPTPLVLLLANQRLKRDPLLRFGWPGEPHRRAARYHAKGIETLLRGSNDAAKTGTGSAITVATLQGKKALCGEPLPEVEMPATWWVLVQTYKQQVDASQAWILRWLGDHLRTVNARQTERSASLNEESCRTRPLMPHRHRAAHRSAPR